MFWLFHSFTKNNNNNFLRKKYCSFLSISKSIFLFFIFVRMSHIQQTKKKIFDQYRNRDRVTYSSCLPVCLHDSMNFTWFNVIFILFFCFRDKKNFFYKNGNYMDNNNQTTWWRWPDVKISSSVTVSSSSSLVWCCHWPYACCCFFMTIIIQTTTTNSNLNFVQSP